MKTRTFIYGFFLIFIGIAIMTSALENRTEWYEVLVGLIISLFLTYVGMEKINKTIL